MANLVEVHQQALAVADAVTDVHQLWDQVYTKHQRDVHAAIEVGHQVHMSFYHFLKEISELCAKSCIFFKGIRQEMEIAKKQNKFDATSVKEIKTATMKIKDVLDEKKERNQKLLTDMSNSAGAIRAENRSLDKILEHYSSLKNAITSASIGGVIGVSTTLFLSSLGTVASGGLIPLGGLLVALISGGFVGYLKHLKKKNLKVLANLMVKMLDKMVSLQQASVHFEESLGDLAEKINDFTETVDKVVGTPVIPEGDRGRTATLADDMLEESKELEACFKSVGRDVTSRKSGLRSLIRLHDPLALTNE